ncbi:MAG: VanZ family protein [Minwuia sp.]|nr:VanZ family protein [Minwuia sp.]
MMTSSVADRGLPAAPLLLAATVLLTFLTLLHFHGPPRFQADGTGTTYLASEVRSLSGADGDDTPDSIEFTHDLGNAQFVRVSAMLAASDIVQGRRRWQQGRLIAVQLFANDRPRYDVPHVVARLSGDRSMRAHAATFRVERGSAQLLLRAEVLATTGFLRVRYLQVQPLIERPGFTAGSNFIISCWVLLALGISFWVFSGLRQRRFRPALAYAVAAPALLLSILPATATAPLRLGVARRVDLSGAVDASGRAAEAALSSNLFSLAKTGHVVMFTAVGLAFALAMGRGRAMQALGLALGFGLVAEMLQMFSSNRTASLFDVGLNLSSAIGGILIATCGLYFWHRLVSGRQSRS